MSNVKDTDLLELIDRYNYLVKEYVQLSIEMVPKIEKFGKYRNELQIISDEFVSRGYKPEDSDSLKKMIELEIEKRKSPAEE